MRLVRRRPDGPKMYVSKNDLVPDNRLVGGDIDHLEHEAIAIAVADIAYAVTPPVNIALFGPWGSGKSSVYSMVEARLDEIGGDHVRVVRYDAWKYGGADLKRNFIASVAADLGLSDDPDFGENLRTPTETNKLNLRAWVGDNLGSLGMGVVLALAVGVVWILGTAIITDLFTDNDFRMALELVVPATGTVFGLALVALLVGPKVLESASVKVTTAPPATDDAFAERFAKMVDLLGELSPPVRKLVVFVDELDRCTATDVISTLVDLKTFLNDLRCVFIVAADREVIERSLREARQHARSTEGEDPYYATPGEFLDKIFQHQLQLPPLRARTLTRFARKLVDTTNPGLWKEIHDHDPDLFETVIFVLVPAHVASPRRVKVLLNNFATNARIAQARGVVWLDRAGELAALTVLQTEFPAVADDLVRIPRLPAYLRGDLEAVAPEVRKVVRLHGGPFNGPDNGAGSSEDEDASDTGDADSTVQRSVSGDIVAPEVRDRTHAVEAARILRERLAAYLAKIQRAGVPDPRPDLLYLKPAELEGVDDPRLGDLIDMAADTAPDMLVDAFAGQSAVVVGNAVSLLVAQIDDASTPERAFILESACRLVEGIDHEDLGTDGAAVAATVLAWVDKSFWPAAAVPGALLLATRAGHADVALKLANGLDIDDSDLLSRIVAAYPFASMDVRAVLAERLVANYAAEDGPLTDALRTMPLDDAVQLWAAAAPTTIDLFERLEVPLPATVSRPEATATSPSTSSAAATAAATPTDSVPTGDGRAGLQALMTAARKRSDGERLASSILAAAQASTSEEIRDEALALASDLFPAFEDPGLVQHHILLAFGQDTEKWIDWFRLRNEGAPVTADEADGQLALVALTEVIIPKASDAEKWTVAASEAARWLARLIPAVSAQDVAGALASQLETIGWGIDEEGSADDTTAPAATPTAVEAEAAKSRSANGEIAADTRATLRTSVHELIHDLDYLLDAERVTALCVDDMMNACKHVELDTETMTLLGKLLAMLDAAASKELSAQLDGYTPQPREVAQIALLHTIARARAGEPPLPAEKLDFVDKQAASTSVINEWLPQNPPLPEVLSVIGKVNVRADTIRAYAEDLDTADRTDIWIALEAANVSNQVLRGAGDRGVDHRAVDAIADRVVTSERQDARDAAAERLMTAKLAVSLGAKPLPVTDQAFKSVSEVAEKLLDTGGARNARLAADLVLWAGAAGYGYEQRLRQLFNEAAKKHESMLKQSHRIERLTSIDLLSPRKRKWFGK